MNQDLLTRFFAGEVRALSRLISWLDNQNKYSLNLMTQIGACPMRAQRWGITGPPGAGKSTLVNALVTLCRQNKQKVAVVAIDPSSPFSGGALLGDRIRMQKHNGDDGVFIRSLATHGAQGGVSLSTPAIVDLLDVFGFDIIIIETVGVGQTEVDIMRLAHKVLVVLVPESGDTVQTLKAGLMEIADIFAVNKADREGADRLLAELESLVEGQIPTHKLVAQTGQGLEELLHCLQSPNSNRKPSHPLLLAQNLFLNEASKVAQKFLSPNLTNPYLEAQILIQRFFGGTS